MQLASLRIIKAVLLVFLVLAAAAWLTRPAAPGEPPPGNSVVEAYESLLALMTSRLAEASAVHDARHPAIIWLRERIAELEAELERARAYEPEPGPEGRLWLLSERR